MRSSGARAYPLTVRALAGLLCLAMAAPLGAQGLPVPSPPSATALREALARYAHEPEVSFLVERAVALADADPKRARSLARRARRSALLPELRLSARRGRGRDYSATQSTSTDRTDLSADDDLSFEASLVFPLGRGAYGVDEVSWAREERARAEAREELVRTVVELYFERRRLQLERDVLGVLDVEKFLRILEIEGLLDGLTGGAFREVTEARAR